MTSSEPTLMDVISRLDAIEKKADARLDVIEKKIDAVDKRLETLDSRFYDFSMRIVTTNQSAFWSISIALLSAVIAFTVARISGGNL